ncbi:MAG: SurA N-terminal domain-containing protein [Gammaproteobacteria bacterium]|nr:SurA N-terminal domain-containing protein [Gammaproteobacteria bacterium]
MLTKIRDRASGWIAWVIVFLISIPFALWGINEYFAGVDEINVAEINGVEIDQQTYRAALEDRRDALSRALGTRADPELINSKAFRRGVLDGLIQRTLLVNDATDKGFRVSNEQLRRYIESAPQFQRDGVFDTDLYQQVVSGYRYTTTGFEERLRQENVLQQVRSGFTDSAFVTVSDMDTLLRHFQQKRAFQYVTISPEEFRDVIEVSDAEIEQDYQSNSSLYETPEQIKTQYVRLAVSDLKGEVNVGEDELRSIYENNAQRFTTPERRKASHILIQVKESDSEDRVAELREKAESLLQQIKDGAEFAELAREHSEDPGSAAQGGDLGFVEKGAMVEPFESALYKLADGEISAPVRTQFGFHLIKLTELVPQVQQTFDEVRSQLEEEEVRRQAEDLFLDRAETFRNLVYEQPETLDNVSEELKLPLQTSEWFSRNLGAEGGISENAKFRETAFSDEVYAEGLNSETLELDRDTLVALRKLELKPEALRPLQDVRDRIVEKLKAEKARERVRVLSEEMLQKLKDGEEWSSVTAADNLDAQDTVVTRADTQTGVSQEVVKEVFKAGYPAAGEPIYGSVNLQNGSNIVYRLDSVEEGDPAIATDELRERVKAVLLRRRGEDPFLAYLDQLREGADIVVFEDQL